MSLRIRLTNEQEIKLERAGTNFDRIRKDFIECNSNALKKMKSQTLNLEIKFLSLNPAINNDSTLEQKLNQK